MIASDKRRHQGNETEVPSSAEGAIVTDAAGSQGVAG